MSQPIPYARQFNFTDHSATFPDDPHPGAALDAEFNATLATLRGVLANLARLQRDDGGLANHTVTLDSLSPAVMYALGAGVVWLPRGAWVPMVAYAISDVVQAGTATYVCAVAHTATVLIDDIASGYWIKLFEAASSIPADGSVTAGKLAPGAVTEPAIGFTALDLAGNIRGGGLQAGTAPLGGLMHAKDDTGDVIVKAERATKAQGAVGYRIIGASVTWDVQQAAGSDDLQIGTTAIPGMTKVRKDGGMDHAGHVRSTASAPPTAGAGVSAWYGSSVGYLDAFDHTAAAWLGLRLRGQSVFLSPNGVDVLAATSASVWALAPFRCAPNGVDDALVVAADAITISVRILRDGLELGYRDRPQNHRQADYVLTVGDRGKHLYLDSPGFQAVVIPSDAQEACPIGTEIDLVSNGANGVTVLPASGVMLRWAGTNTVGARNLNVGGLATLLKVGPDHWWLRGVGIS